MWSIFSVVLECCWSILLLIVLRSLIISAIVSFSEVRKSRLVEVGLLEVVGKVAFVGVEDRPVLRFLAITTTLLLALLPPGPSPPVSPPLGLLELFTSPAVSLGL